MVNTTFTSRRSAFLVAENGVIDETHRFTSSHRQTLAHQYHPGQCPFIPSLVTCSVYTVPLT